MDESISSSNQNDLKKVRWASRVNPSIIRRLYETDARSIVDDELIDKVGFALDARCESILRATEAHERGRVTCPRCEQIIMRPAGSVTKDVLLTCVSCNWSVQWNDYLKTYQDKHLHGGGAIAIFEAFIKEFRRAHLLHEKMLAIDRLIHSFHWELVKNPGRTVATNLIYAKNKLEVLTFLDTLSCGESSTPGLQEGKKEWERKLELSDQRYESGFLSSKAKRQAL